MTLIRQYVDALLDQDALALSKLFSPTAIFVDHCPRDAGKPLVSTYGPEAIDMFYHNRFLFRHFRITDARIVSDTQAYYYAVYDGYHVCALATITEFSSDGRRKKERGPRKTEFCGAGPAEGQAVRLPGHSAGEGLGLSAVRAVKIP